jgi:hypothetical protein
MQKTLEVLAPLFSNSSALPSEKEMVAALRSNSELEKIIKKVMPFAAQIKVRSSYLTHFYLHVLIRSLFTYYRKNSKRKEWMH